MSSPSDVEPSGGRGRFLGLLRTHRLWAALAAAVVIVAVVMALRWSSADPGSASPSTESSSATSSPSTSPLSPSPEEPSASPATAPEEPIATSPGEDPGTAAPGEDPGSAAPGARPTAAPVPIDGAAEPEPQVSVRLTQIEAVQGEANLPGEVGGPSLRVTVSVSNATAAELDLTSAVVNLYYGPDRVPAIDLREPGRRDLPIGVAPGNEATGAFVFLVPVESRGDVTIEFDLSSDSTVLLFAGPVE